MHPRSPLHELTYWREQRSAIMEYIDAAADSTQRQERLNSFTGSMRKIDAKILRLENQTQTSELEAQTT